MTLSERCDEIVRLIDETLEDYATSVAAMQAGVAVVRRPLAAERPLVTKVRSLAQIQRERLARSA